MAKKAQRTKQPLSPEEPTDVVQYKDFIDAFNVPIQEDRDYISRLPSETLDQVLSYLILDHDPDRGVKLNDANAGRSEFKKQTHALLTFSAMSKHFMSHVESFSRRHLAKHKKAYRFKTTAEIQEARRKVPTRRSQRLTAKAQDDPRSYRVELVKSLQTFCIHCRYFTVHRAPMANAVACCQRCEKKAFPLTIKLTEALRGYDLRDYMLLKCRKPGPRAKHTNLPTITYGTLRCGNGWSGYGMCVSYRFYKRDVEMIAALVHGDVAAHMESKHEMLQERKDRRLRKLHIELKIRLHADRLAAAKSDERKAVHQKNLDKYQDPNWDGEWRHNVHSYEGYGNYDDVHERICQIDPCMYCEEEKRMKYCPWW